MKKTLFLILIALTALPGFAAESEPGTNIFNDAVSKIKFNLKTYYQKDEAGPVFVNELGIETRQTLYENFLADVYIRLLKPMSNDNGGVTVELLKGNFQYAGTYFQIMAGRAEANKIFSTMNFFGNYSLGGQKYIDMLSFTLPLFLTGGIPEIDEYKFPPVALSLYYMPTMFKKEHTNYSGEQAFFGGQMRLNTILWEVPTQAIINLSKSFTEYFIYNIMSGNLTIESSLSFDFFKHYKMNINYGTLNVEMFAETTVISAGLELHDFQKDFFVIDNVIFEVQIPFEENSRVMTWFVSAENKINRFRYGIACSNTTNKMTLSDVNLLVSDTPYGHGNLYAKENILFENNSADNLLYYVYVGYEF